MGETKSRNAPQGTKKGIYICMEEMNEFETKPRGTFWRDWGVYGALALCLAIIGAAVALTSLPKEEARISPLPTEKGVAEAVSEATLPPKAVEEALETGRFLYFAHPDVLWFTGPDDIYEEEMTGLCRYCKKAGIPMEVNLLGLWEDRNYPNELFWKIAAREGNEVIYGFDAHRVDQVYSEAAIAKADRFLEKCGIPRERLIEVMEM